MNMSELIFSRSYRLTARPKPTKPGMPLFDTSTCFKRQDGVRASQGSLVGSRLFLVRLPGVPPFNSGRSVSSGR